MVCHKCVTDHRSATSCDQYLSYVHHNTCLSNIRTCIFIMILDQFNVYFHCVTHCSPTAIVHTATTVELLRVSYINLLDKTGVNRWLTIIPQIKSPLYHHPVKAFIILNQTKVDDIHLQAFMHLKDPQPNRRVMIHVNRYAFHKLNININIMLMFSTFG